MYIAGGIIGLIILISLFRSMWRVAEPNEALVVSGFGAGKKDTELNFKTVAGAGTFVIPGLQKVRSLSLSLREAQLKSNCVTTQGIQVGIIGVCMYKIGDDDASIANAARRFLDTDNNDIDAQIQNILDGHLRSIIGNLTVEDLIRDRDKLTGQTRDAAGSEMQKLGLVIDSLQIQSLDDPSKYIEAMAAPHVAEIGRQARVARAAADQASVLAEQEAAANMASATKDSQVKQANYAAEIAKAKAIAEQQGPLAQAQAQQAVVTEQTKMVGLEAERKEKELEVGVRKPADAQAYSITVMAKANKEAAIASAQGESESLRLRGEGEGKAIQAKGEAEGAATRAKVLAEAAGIEARGKAFAQNKEAIINQTIAEQMSAIVKEAASAFGNIKNLTVLEGGEGVSKIIGNIVGTGVTLLPMLTKAFSSTKDDIPKENK